MKDEGNTQLTITLIGLGLIGSSLARGLYNRAIVNAFDFNKETLAYALSSGFVHAIHENAAESVKEADIIILAVPPDALHTITQEIALHLKPGAIITDVASVKCPAINAITLALPPSLHYVPAHPIAGSEKKGVEAGNAYLFQDKLVILTPHEADLMRPEVEAIKHLWQGLGARIAYMPPEIHDVIYGYISHLPQLLAFAVSPFLIHSDITPEYTRFLRLTASPATLWADIASANAIYISEALTDFCAFSMQIKNELEEKNAEKNDNITPENCALLVATLLSNCLTATVSTLEEKLGADPRIYAGTGFADMTALSTRNPEDFFEAISTNNRAIAGFLDQIITRLHTIQQNLHDKNALLMLFS